VPAPSGAASMIGDSIIRGAALAGDPKMPNASDYFVMHTVDADMFLQVKALQLEAQTHLL